MNNLQILDFHNQPQTNTLAFPNSFSEIQLDYPRLSNYTNEFNTFQFKPQKTDFEKRIKFDLPMFNLPKLNL